MCLGLMMRHVWNDNRMQVTVERRTQKAPREKEKERERYFGREREREDDGGLPLRSWMS